MSKFNKTMSHQLDNMIGLNLLPDKLLDNICPIKKQCKCGNSVDLIIQNNELMCPDCIRDLNDNPNAYDEWRDNEFRKSFEQTNFFLLN